MPSSVPDILALLKSKGNPRNVAGMARYGIIARRVYGVPTPAITALARAIGKNHSLATSLWKTGVYDARILAIFVEPPERVTEAQMERWVRDFDNWAICDGVCLHLFDKTPYAHRKALVWSARKEEFVRRAGFVLMAVLAVHDKEASDQRFQRFLRIVKQRATDERNFVKKAVNWALRQIGKRNIALNREAVRTAKQIARLDSAAARWIARDALRELQSPAVQERLSKKASLRSSGKRASSPGARIRR